MSLVVRTQPAQPTPVLVPDMGIQIPEAGGSATFTDRSDLEMASESEDLLSLALATTLILSDGVADIPVSKAAGFLAALTLIADYAGQVLVAVAGTQYTPEELIFDEYGTTFDDVGFQTVVG